MLSHSSMLLYIGPPTSDNIYLSRAVLQHEITMHGGYPINVLLRLLYDAS